MNESVGVGDVFTFRNDEYVVIKVNPANFRVYNLVNKNQYNLSRKAPVTNLRAATNGELQEALGKANGQMSTDEFNVGDRVRITSTIKSKYFTTATMFTVVKVNQKTVKIQKAGTGVTFTATPGILKKVNDNELV